MDEETKDRVYAMIRKSQPCSYSKATMWVIGIIGLVLVYFLSIAAGISSQNERLVNRVSATEQSVSKQSTDMEWMRQTLQEIRSDVKELRRNEQNPK